ncbi:MAG: AAA family ATPase [Planctomycetota bacterium]|jgi:MoxR-like ATPase
MEAKELMGKFHEVETAMNGVLFGREELIRDFLTGILAGGHILLEGLPGMGKTMMVKALSQLCSLRSTRIQFTPDLMPLDITGSNILKEEGGSQTFEFHPGPIFGNLVLADEINRASPKTQSALLEAMQERHVTVLGTTHVLPRPFAVLATQNPIELEGTYPLPEAQLDRFLFKLDVVDVSAANLERIINELDNGDLPDQQPLLTEEELLAAMTATRSIELAPEIASYIARLVKATHGEVEEGIEPILGVRYGASPRAAIAMAGAARARAFLNERDTVGFEDVRSVAFAVLRHRILLDYNAKLEGLTADALIGQVLERVPELARSEPESVMERLAGGVSA